MKTGITTGLRKATPPGGPQSTDHRSPNICTGVLRAAVFTAARRRGPPSCPSFDAWGKRTWSVHPVAHDSATQRNEAPATVWMNPENVALLEGRQTQRDKHGETPLVGNAQKVKAQRWAAQGWLPGRVEGKRGNLGTGVGFPSGGNVLNTTE